MEHSVFSIIVPVYNTVQELERCVSSITSQSFSKFEIILVDDGSVDGSAHLCDKLAEKDSRITVIHERNGGSSQARNTGIQSATGEYLMFVDSDDMWDEENALQDISDIIANNNTPDVICFGVSIYNEYGNLVKVRKPDAMQNGRVTKEEILTHLVFHNQYISPCYDKVIRRSYLLENELFFTEGLLSGEDGEWSARVMVTCNTVAVYPNAFYKRIQRMEGSVTSSIGEKNVLDILTAIEDGVRFVQRNSENDTLRKLYLEYWAYQYAMMLGFLPRVKKSEGYHDVLRRVKQLKYLLRYDHVNKVRAIRIMTSLIGVNGVARMVATYYDYSRR